MEKITKTAPQLALQIEGWFLRYYDIAEDAVDGTEQFTFFRKMPLELVRNILPLLSLNANEIPVLVLTLGNQGFIVSTTERFIKLEVLNTESISYTDFKQHTGFPSIITIEGTGIKTNGSKADFGIRKNDGTIVYWPVPTGEPGFAFWNVTKKFDIIGRRYIIK